tara:strand:- start:1612 stop:2094 length:483 start_codon:yes stop_codon:yes gene_type:complete
MNNHNDVIRLISDMTADVADAVDKAYNDLSNMFDIDDRDNETTETAYKRHNAMLWYKLSSVLGTKYKKASDDAKKHLDTLTTIEPEPEETVHIFSSNVFVHSKKQNKNSSSVVVKDLITELSRLGVEKSVLDKALSNATTERRGNVYYNVEILDGHNINS